MNERTRLLQRIAAIDFAIIELHLYMNSHPNDRMAASKLKEYGVKSEALRAEYVEKYGPLLSSQMESNRWGWISNPWPWDNTPEEDC